LKSTIASKNGFIRSHFDFIHLRSLHGAIADWPKLLNRAYDNLVPGGWIQLTDFETYSYSDDDSFPETSSLYHWLDNTVKTAAKFGRVMNIAPEFERLLKEAGFEAVVDTTLKV
jgi:hypothetical protein